MEHLLGSMVPSRNKLFDGTLGCKVPSNNKLFDGTVPTIKQLFDGTVPSTKQLFDGTVPSNSFSLFFITKKICLLFRHVFLATKILPHISPHKLYFRRHGHIFGPKVLLSFSMTQKLLMIDVYEIAEVLVHYWPCQSRFPRGI